MEQNASRVFDLTNDKIYTFIFYIRTRIYWNSGEIQSFHLIWFHDMQEIIPQINWTNGLWLLLIDCLHVNKGTLWESPRQQYVGNIFAPPLEKMYEVLEINFRGDTPMI